MGINEGLFYSYLEDGKFDLLFNRVQMELEEARGKGQSHQELILLSYIIKLYLVIGDWAKVNKNLARLTQMAIDQNHRDILALCFSLRAEYEFIQQNTLLAKAYIQKYMEITRDTPQIWDREATRLLTYQVYEALGQEAQEYLEEIPSIPYIALQRELLLVAKMIEEGKFREAQEALEALEGLKVGRESLWQIYYLRGELLWEAGSRQQAQQSYQRAIQTLESIAERGRDKWALTYLNHPFRRNIYQKIKRTTQDLGLRELIEIIRKINTIRDFYTLISYILGTMIRICNASRGFIIVTDDGSGKGYELGRDCNHKPLSQEELSFSRSVVALVKKTAKPFITPNAQNDPRLSEYESIKALRILSILSLPLCIKRRPVGVIYLDNLAKEGAFREEEIELAQIFADHIAVAIDNAALARRSNIDPLTGLWNNTYFEGRAAEEIKRAKRFKTRVGLLILDLDNFKAINDTHGHQSGSMLLEQAARVIQSTLRGYDLVSRMTPQAATLARYGGDEFEILIPQIDQGGLRRLAERFLEVFKEKVFDIHGNQLRVTVSIGGAIYPESAAEHRELFIKADRALYEAKRVRGCYKIL
jgi:diguanylate cyclase (GGDEF)-like protein